MILNSYSTLKFISKRIYFLDKEIFYRKIFNRRWHISTTSNATKKFCTLLKLIQQCNMVTLSCLVKKNQNLNLRKKRFSLLLKVAFSSQKYPLTSLFSNRVNFFFLEFKFQFFFARQLRMTILDCCIGLKIVKRK